MRDMNRARCLLLTLFLAVGCGGRTALDPLPGAGGSGELGSGGAVSSGGTDGTGGTSGTASEKQPWGAPCTGDQDCREDGLCCDGSTPSCDVTRLPSGDGNNSGQLVTTGDDLTVRDTITGLTWQRDVLPKRSGCSGDNGACTWTEARSYCASLKLNGDSGWHLPGLMELLSIADHTRASPALNPRTFPTRPGSDFWTSIPAIDHPGDWDFYVSFDLGGFAIANSTSPRNVRCVRGARCVPKNRFAVLEGALVQDKVTGLVWQQRISKAEMSWTEAVSFCPTVGPGFRLPTVKELVSLMSLSVASDQDTSAFPDLATISPANLVFWAATPSLISPGAAAWMAGINASLVQDVSFHAWAWCVR